MREASVKGERAVVHFVVTPASSVLPEGFVYKRCSLFVI